MAANSPGNSENQGGDWQAKESAGSAFLQIAVVAIVLGGGVFLYWKRAQTKKSVYESARAARELMLRDNPKDLYAARAKFAEALQMDSADPFSVSSTALIDVLLSGDLGIASEKGAADDFVKQAESVNAPIEEHFAAQALWLLDNGKVQEASDFLEGVIKKGGAPGGIANAMGRVRHLQGKADEARAYLKKGNDLGWRNPRFADDLADSYLNDGDAINAQSFYEKGIDANGEHLRSLAGLARARIARGQDLKKAADDIETVLGKQGQETAPLIQATALTAKAELRRFEQKYDEADKLADQAIAADAAYPWAYAVKGSVLALQNKPGADAQYDKALAIDGHIGALYFEAARSLARTKNTAKAEGYMAAFAKSMKVDDKYHLTFGDIQKDLGNLDKAQAEYAEAVKSNGLNAKAHYALGSVMMSKNDLPGAQKEFESALAAQRTYPDAQVQIGNIKFQQKAYEDALQEFAKALVQMKMANVDRGQINTLLDDVNDRLVKANQKQLAKAWTEQGKQLVR